MQVAQEVAIHRRLRLVEHAGRIAVSYEQLVAVRKHDLAQMGDVSPVSAGLQSDFYNVTKRGPVGSAIVCPGDAILRERHATIGFAKEDGSAAGGEVEIVGALAGLVFSGRVEGGVHAW